MAILHQLFCGSYGAISSAWPLVLTATGTGAGVAVMKVNLSSASSVTLDGNGHFYTDAAGTLGETQTWTLASGWNTLYIKVTSGTSNLVFADKTLVIMWGSPSSPTNDGWSSPTNAPSSTVNCSNFPTNITRWKVIGAAYLTGSLPSSCPPLTGLGLSGSVSASALSGTLYIPSTMLTLSWGCASSSNVNLDLTAGSSLTSVTAGGQVNFTGSINALTSCTYFATNTGQPFNCSGDLSALRNATNLYAPTGTSTCTYPTSGITQTGTKSSIYLRSQTLTQAQGDAFINDYGAATWGGLLQFNIRILGGRTSNSDTGYNLLISKGVSVTVSTS